MLSAVQWAGSTRGGSHPGLHKTGLQLTQRSRHAAMRRDFRRRPYAIRAATSVTSTMPIVGIDLESDPVASGWARSLSHPGGNLTGVFLYLPELGGKQIQLLTEAMPGLPVWGSCGTPRLATSSSVRSTLRPARRE
jgi:hypothetical protein